MQSKYQPQAKVVYDGYSDVQSVTKTTESIRQQRRHLELKYCLKTH